MHIKTVVKYISSHHSEQPSSKNLQANAGRMWRKESPLAAFRGMQIDNSHSGDSLEKLGIKLPCGQHNPTTGHLPLRKTITEKAVRTPKVHCSTIFNSQDMEATWMSINKWMHRLWYIYILWNILKKNEVGLFVEMWMDLESVIQSKVRGKYINAYMCNF